MTEKDIQKFIDEDINPALAGHGGYITIDKFDEDHKHLYLKMGGGCQGCASSTATLQIQIRNFLMEEFPELREIEDVTDHKSGKNPYYQSEL